MAEPTAPEQPLGQSGAVLEQDCASCGEQPDTDEHALCPNAQRTCGHHCNHSWTHDHCDWCGIEFGEGGAVTWGQGSLPLTEEPNPLARKPTGMCGSPKKCARCPNDFLCSMRASAQHDLIRKREEAERCPAVLMDARCERPGGHGMPHEAHHGGLVERWSL